jgi:hypothetical protein
MNYGSNDDNTLYIFHNIVMMKTIKIDMQVLRNHAVVAGSEVALESMLVLRDEANLFIHVLNPLTGHVIDHP